MGMCYPGGSGGTGGTGESHGMSVAGFILMSRLVAHCDKLIPPTLHLRVLTQHPTRQ